MSTELHTVYVPGGSAPFIELARTQTGKLFRKQILRKGEFVHPNDPTKKLVIDDATMDKVVANFKADIVDIVQVPLCDERNRHSEAPDRNLGQVIDVTREGDKVFATIDARKNAEDFGKTYIGASAMLNMDYADTQTGKRHGPTLLHTAITNRPYIGNLDGFEEIVAASADSTGAETPVVLTEVTEIEEEVSMSTKEELIAQLREEHDIDVDDLLSRAESNSGSNRAEEVVEALSEVLRSSGAVSLSKPEDEELQLSDIAEAVIEIATEKATLESQVVSLSAAHEADQQAKAEAEVDDLISKGKVLPKSKDVMVKLARTDRDSFAALVPAEPIVSLSESGVTTHEAPLSEQLQSDIERLSAAANEGRK